MRRCAQVSDVAVGEFCIVAGGPASAVTREILKSSPLPETREALALAPGKFRGRQVLLAAGHDPAGLVYALLELADRVTNSGMAAVLAQTMTQAAAVVERPANAVRAVTRLFTSEVEDKPWFNDREMWPQYLTMLAAQRFNRFNLASASATISSARSPTPTSCSPIPSCSPCRATRCACRNLPDAERDRNLEMLRFISEQTVARGMRISARASGCTAIEWINSPNPNYTIEGLNAENSRPVLPRCACARCCKACPAISGVTFRVHGESGVAEGSYEFWKTVFDGVATLRPQGRDRHARQGHGPGHDRHGGGHRHAGEDLAEVSGPSTWACPTTRPTSASRSSPQARHASHRPDEAQRRARAVSCATVMAT